MTHNIQFHTWRILLFSLIVTILPFSGITSCGDDASKKTHVMAADSVIGSIDSIEQLNKIIEKSGGHLLIFDFYADWCHPCKELEPILEKIAKEKSEMATVYKINIDRNRTLANSFRVGGIPHVVFLKNKKTVLALTGLYPKNMYLKAAERFSAATEP